MPESLTMRFLRRVGNKASYHFEDAAAKSALRAVGLKNAHKIKTFTSRLELQALYDLGRTSPPKAVALEIGSYLGASTCYLAAGLKQVGGVLYCVDTWQNQTMPDGERDTMAEFTQNTAPVRTLLRVIRKPSSQLVAADLPSKVDLAFIDGDHSYEATRSDFDCVVPLLAEKAIVAMHDHLCFEGVARVVGETLATGKWVVRGQQQNLIWLARQPQWG